jgi:molecular chaperone Hsp33
MKSRWSKWITQPGQIRVVAIEGAILAHELIAQQGLQGPAQTGYAEAVVGSLLIASGHKSNESINMNAQGSGYYKQAIIDASPEGRVRGFLIEEKDKSMHTFGANGSAGPWGTGVLSILYTKNFEGKYPYKGMVHIATGYLDEAINEYYRDSEQVTSMMGLDVRTDGHSKVAAANGALIQAMGGASPEELAAIRSIDVSQMRKLAALAADFTAFEKEASRLLGGRPLQMVDTQNLVSFCNCSQERIERALLLSGEESVMEALGEDPWITVTCDFCRTEYKIASDRLKSIFSRDPSRLQ